MQASTLFVLVASLAVACSQGSGGRIDLAPVGAFEQPPVAKINPVTENMFGVTVTDSYRYMESKDADTIAYVKGQGKYTRAVFDAIAPRAALLKRIADFGASFGLVNSFQAYGGRQFYLEREPGSDNFDLQVKHADGSKKKIVDVAVWRASHGGKPFAINYFQPSFDGTKVAVGLSEGGSEDASLYVYDAASGTSMAGPVDRAQFGSVAWNEDGKSLYFTRLAKVGPKDPPTAKYKNSFVARWDLKVEPTPITGAGAAHGPVVPPEMIPFVLISPGAPNGYLMVVNGVQNEIEIHAAPIGRIGAADVSWKKVVSFDDQVTSADARGSELFLLSHKDTPTFKVLALKTGETIASAHAIVPGRTDRVIEGVHAAADATYVRLREGVYSHLLRVPAGSTAVEDVALPFKGIVSAVFTDPRAPGLELTMASWAEPPTLFAYDPAAKTFTDSRLGVRPAFDGSQFVVSDLSAKAADGVIVPMSIVQPKGAKGPQIFLLEAYGSYGISSLPAFSPRIVSMMQEGPSYGVCHVRGGGELGEAWRLGGKDAMKPNTWRDLIACSEDLIARGLTVKEKLFISGGSAGGITMGRAMTDRPDLFAGVIDHVPAANTLRSEFSPNGPPNIPEFGTIANEAGFKNLLEMDSVQHVKDGTSYPAILITTGLNDPRVASWIPAKFAARLQASGTPNPVLLRVDDEAGHGIGSTKTQRDEEHADVVSFMFWRAGRDGWRPTAIAKK